LNQQKNGYIIQITDQGSDFEGEDDVCTGEQELDLDKIHRPEEIELACQKIIKKDDQQQRKQDHFSPRFKKLKSSNFITFIWAEKPVRLISQILVKAVELAITKAVAWI
jgi:hypothetical protein